MKTTTAILLVVFSFVGLRPKQTVEGAAINQKYPRHFYCNIPAGCDGVLL